MDELKGTFEALIRNIEIQTMFIKRLAEAAERTAAAAARLADVFDQGASADMSPAQPEVRGVVAGED
jgi:plasmid maintenance system antidote protein VapI